MASTSSPPIMTLLPTLLLLLLYISTSPALAVAAPAPAPTDPPPTPAPWPLQFHSILFMNYSGALSLIDLWYDWPNGRNFNIMQDQLGRLLYDLEWNNGTSFVYTLDASRSCRTLYPGVGILRPNWLDGAEYLGQQRVDGFLCNVWQKVDFIWYYEDVVTRRPVHWVFYTGKYDLGFFLLPFVFLFFPIFASGGFRWRRLTAGRSAHVMTFEVGAALEDPKWQAPVYCFEKGEDGQGREPQIELGGRSRGIRTQKNAVREFPSSLM